LNSKISDETALHFFFFLDLSFDSAAFFFESVGTKRQCRRKQAGCLLREFMDGFQGEKSRRNTSFELVSEGGGEDDKSVGEKVGESQPG
jgi:hypothetical protein